LNSLGSAQAQTHKVASLIHCSGRLRQKDCETHCAVVAAAGGTYLSTALRLKLLAASPDKPFCFSLPLASSQVDFARRWKSNARIGDWKKRYTVHLFVHNQSPASSESNALRAIGLRHRADLSGGREAIDTVLQTFSMPARKQSSLPAGTQQCRILQLSRTRTNDTDNTAAKGYREDASKGAMLRFEDSLPRLPIPTLEETSKRYLKSVHPLLSQTEYAQTKKAVEDFVAPGGVGHTLQKRLEERREQPQMRNWLSEWWNYGA
jgi:hypothetical protein